MRLKFLPAGDGDCMVLSWGHEDDLRHLVIDGGRRRGYVHLRQELTAMREAGEPLALYVLTHVDADHIEGALEFAADRTRPLEPEDVWFNGFRQLAPVHMRSPRQGDEYSRAIDHLGWPLNRHFRGQVASVETAEGEIDINGLRITMLSPDARRIEAMRERWSRDRRLREQAGRDARPAGLRGSGSRKRPVPDPIVVEELSDDGETDGEPANGSSIAFVAEWEGRRILFSGDAHADVLASSIAPLAEREGGRYRLDLMKASHHGSAKNTTRELMELLDCKGFVVSTDGRIHGHPDPESIARFLRFSPPGDKTLYFNYATERTSPWDADAPKAAYGYETRYPSGTPGFLQIDLPLGLREHCRTEQD